MRHGMVNRKLGRTSGHRLMMFRNQLASLIQNERIITTLPKAKELRPQIERLITLGKNDSVHNRRNAARVIDETAVGKLFDTIGPRFSDRAGGYTRIIKLGPRRGDAAEMAILEFVGYEPPKEQAAAPAAAKGRKAPAETAAEQGGENETEAPAAEEKPKKAAATKKAEPKPKAKAEAKPKAEAKAKAKPKAKSEQPEKKKSTGTKKKSGK